ncbi:MAG: hypothetical protein J6K73_14925 [Clostridia bacterium]|nr:hypothetical protein [Clostridia bacterium]MBP3651062.1 hypothetical protein [Clostridia bacterium]
MSTIWMGLVMASFAGALALVWKRKIEELLGLSILSMVVVLYLFGLVGHLQLGAYVVCGLAAGCAVLCAVLVFRGGWKQQLQWLLTPGFLVFLVLLGWLFIRYRNALVDNHDDYSHWALEIKNMFQLHAIPNGLAESTVYFDHYPPATALFSYFWCWLSRGFSEGSMLRANALLTVSMVLPVMSHLDWKHWKGILPMGFACFLLPMVFNSDSYTAMMIDTALGCVAAYPLYFVYERNPRRGTCFVVCLTCFVLPLVKVSGIGLACLVILMLLAALPGERFGRKGWQKAAWILLPLVCTLASKLSWDGFLAQRIAQTGADASTLAQLLQMIREGMQPYQKQTILAFGQHLVHPATWGPYSGRPFLWWGVLFAIVAVWLYCSEKDAALRARNGRICILLAISGLLYALILLVSYFFHFSQDEAQRVAALERYLSTILIFAALVLLFLICGRLPQAMANRGAWLIFACLLLAVNATQLFANTVGYRDFIRGAQLNRLYHEPSDAVYQALDAQTDQVFVITQSDETVLYWRDRYVFTPVQAPNAGLHAIRSADMREETAPYGCQYLTPEEWEGLLRRQGYTHLYIHQADDAFISGFGQMFENPADIQRGTLFRLAEESAGPVFVLEAQP